MLLELLVHHEGLFMNVLRHLIEHIDKRTLQTFCALSAVNWRLNATIEAHPWWQYTRKLQRCLESIKTINTLRNKFITIREFNNNLTVYSYQSPNRKITIKPVGTLIIYNLHRGMVFDTIHTPKYHIVCEYPWKCHLYLRINGSKPEWLQKYKKIRYTRDKQAICDYIFDC
jgi:hypothetical protein